MAQMIAREIPIVDGTEGLPSPIGTATNMRSYEDDNGQGDGEPIGTRKDRRTLDRLSGKPKYPRNGEEVRRSPLDCCPLSTSGSVGGASKP